MHGFGRLSSNGKVYYAGEIRNNMYCGKSKMLFRERTGTYFFDGDFQKVTKNQTVRPFLQTCLGNLKNLDTGCMYFGKFWPRKFDRFEGCLGTYSVNNNKTTGLWRSAKPHGHSVHV